MAGLKSVYFDLHGWHNGPKCKLVFVSGYGGIGVKVACLTCGKLADVEAVGERVTEPQSRKENA